MTVWRYFLLAQSAYEKHQHTESKNWCKTWTLKKKKSNSNPVLSQIDYNMVLHLILPIQKAI